MTKPRMSVILNTARTGHSMHGLMDVHHFNYTIDALKKQTFKDFELIISDYIHANRVFDWSTLSADFPIYHVPISHSEFHRRRYCAISATKNNGISFSSGEYLIFLDDCCTFGPDFLRSILIQYITRKLFVNALHNKKMGDAIYIGGDGNPVRDCRYQLLDQLRVNEMINNFHLYGYSSCSAQAAFELNGFDEMYDGSRQLEDIDFGERLKKAGYKIALNRNIFIYEQEHLKIGFKEGDDKGPWSIHKESDTGGIKENLKCNGPYFYLKTRREPKDFIEANRRPMTPEEINLTKPCYLRREDNLCKSSNASCNWLEQDHMTHEDAQAYFTHPPVFDLFEMNKENKGKKENFKVN